MNIEIVAYTDADYKFLGEYAARISHRSLDKLQTDSGFLNKIVKSGHTSVLEHWYVTAVFNLSTVDSPRAHLRHILKTANIPGTIVTENKNEDGDILYFITVNGRHLVENYNDEVISWIVFNLETIGVLEV